MRYDKIFKEFLDLEGELQAGLNVRYKKKIYKTGNRRCGMVELYDGCMFYKTVSQDKCKVVKELS